MEAYSERDLDRLLDHRGAELLDALVAAGATIDRREATEASLLVSAIVAARNDPEVARLVIAGSTGGERLFWKLLGSAQESASLSADVSADAVTRFCLVLAVGSLVVEALGMDPVDHGEWTALIERLVGSIKA